ncbi:rRNA adenine N-6-methyltransferase family protein [Streptomyces sp. NPDC088736]|uniref:rRNA adenine N-6-methyltransferase family protein n=1 Tax=Streptomyces sp. NPDC088736 TaxID=3365881 RepID=UPI00382E525A
MAQAQKTQPAGARAPFAGPGRPGTAGVLAQSGFAVRGEFGQHLLRSPDAAGRLLKCAELNATTQVLEAEAGLGTLSAALGASSSRMWAVERDARPRGILQERLRPCEERARVTISDVRGVDLDAGLNEGSVLVSILPFDLELSSALPSHVFCRHQEGGTRNWWSCLAARWRTAAGGGLVWEEIDGISNWEIWPHAREHAARGCGPDAAMIATLAVTNEFRSAAVEGRRLLEAVCQRHAACAPVVDAGDSIGGTAVHEFSKGRVEQQLLSELYDALVPGGHDVAHLMRPSAPDRSPSAVCAVVLGLWTSRHGEPQGDGCGVGTDGEAPVISAFHGAPDGKLVHAPGKSVTAHAALGRDHLGHGVVGGPDVTFTESHGQPPSLRTSPPRRAALHGRRLTGRSYFRSLRPGAACVL